MAKADALLIEPPATSRTRASSADAALVAQMASVSGEGKWVTDGYVYESHGDAGNASQVYRRALAVALGTEVHKVKTRVWGEKDGIVLADREAKGEWKYALTLDPNREKRTRKADTNGA